MLGNLPHELVIATGLVAGTVVIHLVGLEVLMRLTDLYLRRFVSISVHVDRLLVPLGIVLGLFILHGAEIWLYAAFFLTTGILPNLEEALYFSTSAYSTLGEAGAILPKAWRVVGTLEGVNGMLLIGWSTAFLFQMLGHLMDSDEDHPLPKGAISRSASRAPQRTGGPRRTSPKP